MLELRALSGGCWDCVCGGKGGTARPEAQLPVTLRVPACTPDTALPTTRLQGSWLSLALTSRCRPGVWDLGWDPGQWSLPIGSA